MPERTRGYVAAVLHSCVIGFSFLIVKTSLQSVGTPILLAHRFILAFSGVLIVKLFLRIDVSVRGRDFLSILLLAVFYPLCFFLFQSLGLQYTSSSVAGILQSTAPVFVVLLAAIILKERTGGIRLFGVFLTVSGVALLSLRNAGGGAGGRETLGAVLILISSFSSGFYSVLSRKLSKSYPAFTLTFWMMTIGGLGFSAYALASLAGSGDYAAFLSPLKESDYALSILYLGLLSSLGSSYLSNYALGRLEAAKMSVFSGLGTVISVAAGVLILNEPFQVQILVAMLVIVTGVLLTNKKQRLREPDPGDRDETGGAE